jgi:hypothetical protein
MAHEANAVSKMRALALLDHNGNKKFVCHDIKVLAIAQIHSKNMLMVVGLPMRDRETRDSCIQHGSVSHTIQVVNTLACHFKNICTSNSERHTGNVRKVMSGLCPDVDVDVQPQTRLERCTLEQREITRAVVVKGMPKPSLEMWISGGASTTFYLALSTTAVAVNSVSVITFFTNVNVSVAAKNRHQI